MNEDLLDLLVAETKDLAISLLDVEGHVATWTAGAQRIKGFAADEIIGRHFSVFYPPEDVAAGRPRRELETAAANGRSEDDGWRVRQDGTRFWANVVITALRDAGGSLRGFGEVTRDMTERRAHELTLRCAESRFRRAFQDAAVPLTITSALPEAMGRYLDVNDAMCGLLGYDRERLLEQTVQSVTHPDDLERDLATLSELIRGEIARFQGEKRYIHATGDAIEASIGVSLIRDADGRPLYFITQTEDITARRLEERRLQHADERVRQLLDAAPDAMIVADTGGVIQTVNDQTTRLLGYTREELIGESIDRLVPGPDRAGHPRHRAEFAADPSTRAMGVERELNARHKDGSHIAVSITLSPVATEDGLLITASVRDITERRREQARLQVAEEQFRRSFDDAPIGMMIIGLDGRYIQVNDAFCTIVGHPRQTLIGLSREAITHPDELDRDDKSVRDLLSGAARSFTRETRLIHAAGHAVWTSFSVTLIRTNGQPKHFIAQAQDITERRRYETQLKHMADHDPLTGLLNRRSFRRELESHIARVKRFGAVGAVLMVDLDNFKYYNDIEGHNAGDHLIVRIAQALQSRLRETDVIARLGGDEFAILTPQEDFASAEIVAHALVEVIRDQAPAPTLGERRRVTASIGIACFTDGDRLTAEEIMVNADLAMYDAKETGRNRIAHYRTDEYERPRIESQMKWATEITQALAEDRFELLGQPIVPLGGRGPTQYELLLRMRDAHGDRIPPGTFLYIAERIGLIHEIDRWVAAHAIDLLAEHRAAGRDLRFEVNLSGHTIGDPELLDLIERRLDETGVPPDRLIFEITETAAVANIARAATFAGRLSDLGCKFALDDFGAGFGSFYYLKHLPFDYLKIDGEYVRHCATNETDRILIAAVVQIARGMGKQTIAEFVGDQESVEVLTRLGVDFGQGYFLGRPEPLANHLGARPRTIHN